MPTIYPDIKKIRYSENNTIFMTEKHRVLSQPNEFYGWFLQARHNFYSTVLLDCTSNTPLQANEGRNRNENAMLTLDSPMPVVVPLLQESRSREQMKAAILELVKENPGMQYLEISLALHLRLRTTAELVKELVQSGNLRSDPVTNVSDGE